MIRPAIPRIRLAAYCSFVAFFAAAVAFKLGPAMLAAVFSYTVIDAAYGVLVRRMRPLVARVLALAVFVVTAVLIGAMFYTFLRQSMIAVPNILAQVIPRLNEISLRYGIDLPFDNIHQLRDIVIDALAENVGGVSRASSIMTRRFFHIIIGMLAAVLCFLDTGRRAGRETLYDVFRSEFNERVARFMLSVQRVVGAQVTVSAINAVITAGFLLVLGFPFVAFLVPATFILGIFPVVGNLASNTIIVCTALTMSPGTAVYALGLLIVIHKGEYFLNSRIVGSSIDAPMWQTLLGIMVGEVIIGVPGIILAPALLHYVKQELKEISWPASPEARPSGSAQAA